MLGIRFTNVDCTETRYLVSYVRFNRHCDPAVLSLTNELRTSQGAECPRNAPGIYNCFSELFSAFFRSVLGLRRWGQLPQISDLLLRPLRRLRLSRPQGTFLAGAADGRASRGPAGGRFRCSSQCCANGSASFN